MTPYNAFFYSLALSLGNADIYARASFFFFMFFITFYLVRTKKISLEALSTGNFKSKYQENDDKIDDDKEIDSFYFSSPFHKMDDNHL